MARPRVLIPKLCCSSRGYLFAKDRDGNQHWFGLESDPASRHKYADFIAALQRGDMAAETRRPKRGAFCVSELCIRFLTQYAVRYRNPDGTASGEVRCFRSAILHLRKLFGETPVNDFGPLRLQAVRQSMIDAGWSRRWINKQVARIRLIFRIGVSWEIVCPDVLAALESVPALVPGESSAPETEPRTAVSDAELQAVRDVLCEKHRDIFDLLLLCGARPGELLNLTTGIVDRTGAIWRVDLSKDKTSHRGKSRTLFFNFKAQLILSKYLINDATKRLFTIRGDTLSKAFKAACLKAGVPPFVPHQLRHTVATRLADEVGLEAAQRLMGHSTRAMTEHYSRAADKQAIDAVRRLG